MYVIYYINNYCSININFLCFPPCKHYSPCLSLLLEPRESQRILYMCFLSSLVDELEIKKKEQQLMSPIHLYPPSNSGCQWHCMRYDQFLEFHSSTLRTFTILLHVVCVCAHVQIGAHSLCPVWMLNSKERRLDSAIQSQRRTYRGWWKNVYKASDK